MNNIMMILIFLLVLIVLFWLMPNKKIETIGDFMSKIVDPLATPLAFIIASILGVGRLKNFVTRKKDS